jgi:hypothetical protein
MIACRWGSSWKGCLRREDRFRVDIVSKSPRRMFGSPALESGFKFEFMTSELIEGESYAAELPEHGGDKKQDLINRRLKNMCRGNKTEPASSLRRTRSSLREGSKNTSRPMAHGSIGRCSSVGGEGNVHNLTLF